MNQLQRLLSARSLSHPIIPLRVFFTGGCSQPQILIIRQHRFHFLIRIFKRLKIELPIKAEAHRQQHLLMNMSKFSAIADTWWHSEGPFKPLHLMNPTRLAFIRSTLCRHFQDPSSARPFEGLRLIYVVVCGVGLLSECLAQMGATVTGIDAVGKNVKIARVQAVIEHVANPAEFCKSLSALTVPNGATLLSTINRTMRAYASTIVAAEYILRWLPEGTHQWSSFLAPEEVTMILQRASVDVKEMAGFVYNPITGRWLLSGDISVNFIAYGTKRNDLGDI